MCTNSSGADFDLHPQCDFQSYTHDGAPPPVQLHVHGNVLRNTNAFVTHRYPSCALTLVWPT